MKSNNLIAQIQYSTARLRFAAPLVLLLLALFLSGCGDKQPPISMFTVPPGTPTATASTPCADQNPQRNAYFGDLHVHTSFSADAWAFDLRLGPNGAYRYAFGESVALPPLDTNGNGTRNVQLDRPLDFAAVTDHAEFLGENLICSEPQHPNYNTSFCQMMRANTDGIDPQVAKYILSPITWRNDEACGADSSTCFDASRTQWDKIIEAAERWNDDTENCERTAFIGYEYSSYRLAANLHRNVIFRNSAVPALPVSYIEAPREWELWRMLKAGCKDTDSGCDVLSIPHNSNISNGRMFNVDYIGTNSKAERLARARLQIEMEPIVEIMQHKGDSECRDGMVGVLNSEDELCNFEKFLEGMSQLRTGTSEISDDICFDGRLGDSLLHLGPGCDSWSNYVRYALTEGLRQEQEVGANPFKFGITASTDTHNALAGGVDERSFAGHLGITDDTALERTAWDNKVRGNANSGPGGLVGIWAEQNNRDALFDAMRRKEVFGTSGPRIKPRFFGGWDLPANLCDSTAGIAKAYAQGVPMGGDLPVNTTQQKAPTFMVSAAADSGTATSPGTPLQRLQVIKGWVDKDGERRQRVFEVAGDPNNGATVNTNTCQTTGSGFSQLCKVWRDPEFDATTSAVYYLRAVENPTCRFNAWQCASFKGKDRPAGCDDANAAKTIQERAWSSPIWYTPAGDA